MDQLPEKSVSYTYKLKVEAQHIDTLMHVNNVVYLQWVNDISEKHWDILAKNGLTLASPPEAAAALADPTAMLRWQSWQCCQ